MENNGIDLKKHDVGFHSLAQAYNKKNMDLKLILTYICICAYYEILIYVLELS